LSNKKVRNHNKLGVLVPPIATTSVESKY
jgi:hypothetical protein